MSTEPSLHSSEKRKENVNDKQSKCDRHFIHSAFESDAGSLRRCEGSPGHRARLAALREQLGKSQSDEAALDREPQARDQPADCIQCPLCGQVMQKQKIMPNYERKPP